MRLMAGRLGLAIGWPLGPFAQVEAGLGSNCGDGVGFTPHASVGLPLSLDDPFPERRVGRKGLKELLQAVFAHSLPPFPRA